MKKISFIFISIFCFFTCLLGVHAQDLYINKLDFELFDDLEYINTLVDEKRDLDFYKNYIENYFNENGKPTDYYFCSHYYNGDYNTRFYIACYFFNSDNIKFYSSNSSNYSDFTLYTLYQRILKGYFFKWDYNYGEKLSFSTSDSFSNSMSTFASTFSNYNRHYLSTILFSSNNLTFTSTSSQKKSYSYYFDREYVKSFPVEFRQHYGFSSEFFSSSDNFPLLSFDNLLNGNYPGFYGIDVNLCIDKNCTFYDKVNYHFSNIGDDVNIKDLLPVYYEDYKLDDKQNLVIKAKETKSIDVNYVPFDVPYEIHYYFDNVLQENLTEKKTGLYKSKVDLSKLDRVKDDVYFLDSSKVYNFVLDNIDNNIIDVYYNTKDVNYNVNVYLDDIYYQSHSFVGTGKVGQEVVLSDLVPTIGIFNLDERDYKLSLVENISLNYINVYYYSNKYDTEYQDIDTSDKFYIAFSWVRIRDLFNLKGEFTQSQQWQIVYEVNILFYVIVVIFAYFGLKMLNRLFSLFKMF